MYRFGAPQLGVCLWVMSVMLVSPVRADEESLPPPPPPTAPDSIIPSGPPPTAPDTLEQPPAPPDRLPPTGSLAPQDIPDPPTLQPTPPILPDTTEPGTPAPDSPTKPVAPTKKVAEKKKEAEEKLPAPPPPATEAETRVKADDNLDHLLEPKPEKEPGKEKEEDKPELTEAPPPSPPPHEEEAPPVAKEEHAPPTPSLSVSERARLRHIPAYQKALPNWGFQLSYSPGALGNTDIADASQGAKATGTMFQFEYQPTFLQQAGIVGFGPTIAIFPVSSDFNVTTSSASIWSVGFQARYQARFFREQPVVPVAGFAWERLTYHLKNLGPPGNTRDANSSINLTGPFFGAWFLLNILEPDQAASAYINSGLVRSYLTAELRLMSGSDDDVNVSGTSYYLGLRVEF